MRTLDQTIANMKCTLIFAVAAIALFSACSTMKKEDGEVRLGSEDPIGDFSNSTADGAAFAAEGFTFRKEQKARRKNDFIFYYKSCAIDDDGSYYSKTAYLCTVP